MRHLAAFTIRLFVAALLGPAIVTLCIDGSHCAACAATTISDGADDPEQQPDQSNDDTKKLIRSKHDRKVERMNNWTEGLEGDKARIYRLYGYPSGKYREEVMGTVIERWVYPEHGVTFKFKGNKLTR